MRTRLLLPALAILTGLAAAAPASAQQLPLGFPADDRAVTATASAGAVTFRFSASSAAARSAYRRIAGKKVYVYCMAVRRKSANAAPIVTRQDTSYGARAGKRLGSVRVPLRRASGYDVCTLLRWDDEKQVAVASVSTTGAVHLEESVLAARMVLAGATEDGSVRDATAVVVEGDGRVVGLASADATPPAGKIGYWTDGAKWAVVAVTSGGRRLFWECEGDTVRTNTFWLVT